MTDRGAATAGFVLAGVALAASIRGWPGRLAPAAAALSAVALVVLALRRYGRLDPATADPVAILGGVGAMVAAVASLVAPSLGGPGAAAGGWPAILTAVAGLGASVLAWADRLAIDDQDLRTRVARTATAAAIGLAGLLAILLWTAVLGTLYRATAGSIDPTVGTVLSSVALGLGTGTVAWGYLRGSGRGLDFIDLRWPTPRDGAYVVGGLLLLLALNVGIGALFRALGLAEAHHTIFDVAQRDPALLLVLIPLSILLIGPGEELLFRNVVQKSLYDAFSRPAAIVVASAIFASVHVPAYSSAGATPLSILDTLTIVFALAIVLGVAYERTGNVLVSALIHGTFNAIAFALTYVQLTR